MSGERYGRALGVAEVTAGVAVEVFAALIGLLSAAVVLWRPAWAFGTLVAASIWVEVVHAGTASHWQYVPWLVPAFVVLVQAARAGPWRIRWEPLVAWSAAYGVWVVLVAVVHHGTGDLNYAAGVPVVLVTALVALPRVHAQVGGRPWHQLLMVLAGATGLLSLAAGVAALGFHQGFPVPVGSHTLLAWQWPFANKNTLGFLTAFGVPAAAILLVEREEPRWLWWVAGILSVMGLALSYSRTGWIAAAVGVLVVAGVVYGRRGVLWAVAGVVVALGLVTAKTGVHRLINLFKHGLSGRTLLWRAALRVARSHWLAGVGPGQSPTAMAPYVPPAFVGLTPSNGPLETLVELGLVGLLLWAAVVAAAIVAAWQRATSVRHFGLWLALLVAGLVEQLAESSFLGGISFEDYLFLAVLAVVVSWRGQDRRAGKEAA